MWFDSTAAQLNADVPVDAYIIYDRRGKFKTLVRVQPSVLGVYAVEFCLREDVEHTIKGGPQGVKPFSSFGR